MPSLGQLGSVLLWGLIATVAMTTILSGSQQLGFSRLSLPFLMGTYVTGNRDRAVFLGFVLYTLGGWAFAVGYFLVFASLGFASWWLGALLGALHGLVLLVVVLPVLPHIHPLWPRSTPARASTDASSLRASWASTTAGVRRWSPCSDRRSTA